MHARMDKNTPKPDKIVSIYISTRGDPEIRGKESLFLHCLTYRAGILAHTTAIHMQLIGHVMFYVCRLCALQLSSRQHYIT